MMILLRYLFDHHKLTRVCFVCRNSIITKCNFSTDLESKYSEIQKEKIIDVINNSNVEVLAGYAITKGKLKQISHWRGSNGKINTLGDLEFIDGFTKKSMIQLYDSILEGPVQKQRKVSNKLKGQILHPTLSETVARNCQLVLALYINVNSVCWTLIEKRTYDVKEWTYHSIEYPDGKRFQISDIFDIASKITKQLPMADIYVMKAEATTLRAAGSDPSNTKAIAVNLQKAQMIAMIVALINARSINYDSIESVDQFTAQKVYFLRPTLPYRLYGTLVGNEKVSTDQTVEMLLQRDPADSQVHVSEYLKSTFRSQKDLQRDMLGHSLLLGLTFMDLCIYKNQESIKKLVARKD